MKKLILTFIVCSILFSMNGFSQERKNVVKTNPLALAFGSFNVTYEKVLNSKSSVLFYGQYMFSLFGEDVSTGGLGIGYRYYFTHEKKEVPSGFYVNPQTGFGFGNIEDEASVKLIIN